MNESKMCGDVPQQQKEIDNIISSAMSRIYNLDRFEKEFAIISERLAKIGMSINPDEHPLQSNSTLGVNKVSEENCNIDNRRPPALLGRIFDIGEKSEEFAIAIGRQLKSINKNLDYIERFI